MILTERGMLRVFSRSVVASAGAGRVPAAALNQGLGKLRRLAGLWRNTHGVSAIEFAIIAPVFLTIATGALKFGVAISNNLLLNNGAAQGAMNLALSRGTSTPYTTTVSAIKSGAGGLTSASITITVKVGSTTCTSDSTCSSALTAGATGSVTATYPCDMTVMGVKYLGSTCTLSATSAAMIQ
jgi:Flp pilus assembly protein TadG